MLRGDHFPDAMCTKTIVIIIATHAWFWWHSLQSVHDASGRGMQCMEQLEGSREIRFEEISLSSPLSDGWVASPVPSILCLWHSFVNPL